MPSSVDPSTHAQPPRIAVVGGGISGLAAAHRLRKLLPRAELQLFDASDRLGGPLYTLAHDDALLEQGADSFLIKTPFALDLCRELGLADQLIPTSEQHRRALVVRDGQLVPVPEGFVLMKPQLLKPMLQSPLFSLLGKARLAAEPLALVPAEVNRPGYDESVASFATRRLGREVYQRLVEPLIAGVYVADAHKLSLAATYPEFLEAERVHGSLWRSVRKARSLAKPEEPGAAPATAARYGQFVTLRGGLRGLVDALVATLPANALRLRTPVMQVERHATNHWTLRTTPGAPLEHFDGVIVAAHAPQASPLLKHLDGDLSNELAAIEYASSAVVTLVYHRQDIDHPLDGFGIVVPAIERRPIVAASFLTVKFPSHGPAGRAIVRVFSGGALQPDKVDRDDAELIKIAAEQMADLIGAHGLPIETHVMRWRDAMPQYHVGHVARVESIEARVASHNGLELAGNAYRGVGIPQSIHSGRNAAERLAKQLAK
ncbi:protoporphyrinogen oxidase [Lacipirellula parvula]|uniref:Coproporphyrinogen III oxidase n=1 Tax=Lacipirellula parvula TaxID=2650471 RepID=A0A5K7X4G4_9BACT|nr:protoporphyrinogen oxidase [Lacipirellula parvula]BBO31275.1 protoporphyrinogen IX oxidase [Lacipirellula parvula]